MPQINLLKEKNSNPVAWQKLFTFVDIFLILVILGLAGYYGWTHFAIKNNVAKTAELQGQMSAEKSAALKSPDRQELLVRQSQLKELEGVLAGHPYWSAVLPALANVSFKQANYLAVKLDTIGVLDISVAVPDTESLDKFLQIFDMPEYNKDFYNLKVGSISNGQKDGKLLTKFDVRMNYNPELLKYSAVSNGSN